MRRKALIALIILLLSLPVLAFTPVESVKNSGLKTASELLYTGAGYLYGIAVGTDGTNAAQIDLYDATSVTDGAQLIPTWVVTTSSTDRMQYLPFDPPVNFNTGLYLRITCSGNASVNVYYRES